jgi:hypothetical protein
MPEPSPRYWDQSAADTQAGKKAVREQARKEGMFFIGWMEMWEGE